MVRRHLGRGGMRYITVIALVALLVLSACGKDRDDRKPVQSEQQIPQYTPPADNDETYVPMNYYY